MIIDSSRPSAAGTEASHCTELFLAAHDSCCTAISLSPNCADCYSSPVEELALA